jgi:hypothetical protein
VRRLAALLLVALAGCAGTPPPPGAQVAEERLAPSVIPGQTTSAGLLAAFGPTRTVRFDSGYEVWLYQMPVGGGRFSEFVILVDPAGVVSKTRRRAPSLP